MSSFKQELKSPMNISRVRGSVILDIVSVWLLRRLTVCLAIYITCGLNRHLQGYQMAGARLGERGWRSYDITITTILCQPWTPCARHRVPARVSHRRTQTTCIFDQNHLEANHLTGQGLFALTSAPSETGRAWGLSGSVCGPEGHHDNVIDNTDTSRPSTFFKDLELIINRSRATRFWRLPCWNVAADPGFREDRGEFEYRQEYCEKYINLCF